MRGITGGRGILGGAVLLAVGFGVLMQAMGVTDAGAYLFLFLGLAFAIAYVAGTQQYVYLVPASVMIGFHAEARQGGTNWASGGRGWLKPRVSLPKNQENQSN